MRGDASRSVVVLGEAVRGGTCSSCRSILIGSFLVFVAKREKKADFRPGFKQETGAGKGKRKGDSSVAK